MPNAFQNSVKQSQQQFGRFQQQSRQNAARQMADTQVRYRAGKADAARQQREDGLSGGDVTRPRRRRWWTLWTLR